MIRAVDGVDDPAVRHLQGSDIKSSAPVMNDPGPEQGTADRTGTREARCPSTIVDR
jgi:hypothetical protein